MILHAFTDGASRGNPGESGIGVILKDEKGNVVFSESGFIGITTNNIAEYTALLTLLQRMNGIACSRLIVHSDSELMVRQLNGRYRVRDENLKEYYRKVMTILASAPFQYEVKHIPRSSNKDADRLANLGIDARMPMRV